MARDGDASDPSLEAFRNYLELLARARMDPRLRASSTPPTSSSRPCCGPSRRGTASAATTTAAPPGCGRSSPMS